MISVRDLSKHYYTKNGHIVANHKINFNLREGEFLLVLGPNGAGKTTLILQLATLLKPTSGSIYIMGYDAIEEPEKVRPYIGLMPQEGVPNVTLTVWENLYFFSRLYGLDKSQAISQSKELIKRLNLESYRNKVAGTLSGGLKRRLLLGLALVRDSKILLLDEPTALQDLEFRSSFYQLISEILNERRTIIYTTNDPYDVQQLGENGRILVLKDGRLLFLGTLNELFERTGGKDVLIGLNKLMSG
jgi:ABC-2 type transport system ATP-binding protein